MNWTRSEYILSKENSSNRENEDGNGYEIDKE